MSNKRYFSEQDIHEIYHTKVKHSPEYYKKYEQLPPCPVKAWNYSWKHYDFPRNWCLLDFKEWIHKYQIKPQMLGYTDDIDPELEFIECEQKQLIKYPEIDLHKIDQSFDNYFDFFLFNQTLEHLFNPFMAVESLYKSIKPGGYIFTSVPTINIPHCVPAHYNGLTPMGLALLFLSANFEIIEMGQWGNLEYLQLLFKNHDWPGYDMLNKKGKVTNEERNGCQCWILAKKPAL